MSGPSTDETIATLGRIIAVADGRHRYLTDWFTKQLRPC